MFGFERRKWWQLWKPLYSPMSDEQMREFIGGRYTNEALRLLSPTLQRGTDAMRNLERAHIAGIVNHIAAYGKLPPIPRFPTA